MIRSALISAAVLATGLACLAPSVWARSDTGYIRCESKNYRHTVCGLPDHGYVSISRQISGTRCVQGRNWDYNWREVWVDDGCAAEFRIELREHGSRHSGDDKDKAAAAVAALAILGAVAVAADSKDHRDADEGRDRGRVGHASYVPRWMVGDFKGYNDQARAEVLITIESDGRVRAKSGDIRLTGYVNDRRIYIGDTAFEVERTDVGFNTTQVGRWSNRVSYRRH